LKRFHRRSTILSGTVMQNDSPPRREAGVQVAVRRFRILAWRQTDDFAEFRITLL
jgi:hypothetical protein